MCFLILVALTPGVIKAQVKPAERDAADPKSYDLNNDGRIDAKDEAAARANESKGSSGAEDTAGSGTVTLSPFEVTESNTGYLATNTMSGTRLNTKLEDLGSSISVVTKQQMMDFAMLDINDVFAYEAGAESADTYTDFEVNRKGYITDKVMTDRQSSNRLRGIGSANVSRSGFATSGRVPVDPIDIDAIEISRGPNSNLFGLGEGSGTVNMVAASANLNRAITTTQVRFRQQRRLAHVFRPQPPSH
jgi:outer membrane receptor for ferric coprogen and ferric-rhodotorulic acid